MLQAELLAQALDVVDRLGDGELLEADVLPLQVGERRLELPLHLARGVEAQTIERLHESAREVLRLEDDRRLADAAVFEDDDVERLEPLLRRLELEVADSRGRR